MARPFAEGARPVETRRSLGQDVLELGVVAVLGEELASALEIVLEREPFLRQLVRGLQLPVLAPDRGRALAVRVKRGIGQLPLELGETALDLVNQVFDHTSKCDARRRQQKTANEEGRVQGCPDLLLLWNRKSGQPRRTT